MFTNKRLQIQRLHLRKGKVRIPSQNTLIDSDIDSNTYLMEKPTLPIFSPGSMYPVASNHRQARTQALTSTALISHTAQSITTRPKTIKDSRSKHSNKTPQSLSRKKTREMNWL